MKIAMIKTPQGFVPASEDDREAVAGIKVGETIHGEFARMRNPAFHRKFFALLNMAYDYWEPTGGLIPKLEMSGVEGLAKFLASKLPEASRGKPFAAAKEYLERLAHARAERYPVVDKSRQAFREHVTVEAGHYHVVMTPAGIKRVPKSISFASMDEAEFQALYRDVFAVCWRLVLSNNFASEEEAMQAAEIVGGFA